MRHEDCAAGEMGEAEDGVPDFVLTHDRRDILRVLLLGRLLITAHENDLDDVENACNT